MDSSQKRPFWLLIASIILIIYAFGEHLALRDRKNLTSAPFPVLKFVSLQIG